ncbi:MAG: hypothetical protein IT324_20300 [Anaerolineae bacterium]|nr:hypothetical protein [Anaerolineae bacterium]
MTKAKAGCLIASLLALLLILGIIVLASMVICNDCGADWHGVGKTVTAIYATNTVVENAIRGTNTARAKTLTPSSP